MALKKNAVPRGFPNLARIRESIGLLVPKIKAGHLPPPKPPWQGYTTYDATQPIVSAQHLAIEVAKVLLSAPESCTAYGKLAPAGNSRAVCPPRCAMGLGRRVCPFVALFAAKACACPFASLSRPTVPAASLNLCVKHKHHRGISADGVKASTDGAVAVFVGR